MRRARRKRTSKPTEVEWAWLTAAPGHNGFIGFFDTGRLTSHARLQRLWDTHEVEIRTEWGDEVPGLPWGHPAENNGKVGGPGRVIQVPPKTGA